MCVIVMLQSFGLTATAGCHWRSSKQVKKCALQNAYWASLQQSPAMRQQFFGLCISDLYLPGRPDRLSSPVSVEISEWKLLRFGLHIMSH